MIKSATSGLPASIAGEPASSRKLPPKPSNVYRTLSAFRVRCAGAVSGVPASFIVIFAAAVSPGFKDGASLHLGNLRINEPETAATETEHGIELVKLLHALGDLVDRNAHFFREQVLRSVVVRQELVEGRVEEPDGGRETVQGFENAHEVALLVGQQLGERLLPIVEVVGENHLAHGVDAIAFERELQQSRQ